MDNQTTKTNPFKGSVAPPDETPEYINARHNAITKICVSLSAQPQLFDKIATYKLIEEYSKQHHRWFYSDISNYLFSQTDDDLDIFNNNLLQLQGYAHEQVLQAKGTRKNHGPTPFSIETLLDKFWDHSNLAQRQKTLMSISETDFANRFKVHAQPYTDNLQKDLSKELISLVSIFTALSFIVFGGINSLDNIFEGAGTIPILDMVIVGCIWSFCILNLVFAFVYLVSKLTKNPIAVVDDPNAPLVKKYPFWIWSNYFLLLLLVVFCWLYYIDKTDSGGWLIAFSQKNGILSACLGVCIIVIVFGLAAFNLLKKKK